MLILHRSRMLNLELHAAYLSNYSRRTDQAIQRRERKGTIESPMEGGENELS